MQPVGGRASVTRVVAAFAAIYAIWGSTYLAIDIAVESIPPLLLIGVRCLVAGGLLYAYARARGAPAPTRRDWLDASVAGALLFVGGQGVVAWAVQHVPSGTAALLNATIPMFAAVIGWRGGALAAGRRAERVRPGAVAGIVMGLAGVALTMGIGGEAAGHAMGGIALLFASFSWAVGSYRAASGSWPVRNAGAHLLAGGVLLVIVSTVLGEMAGLRISAVPPRALLALAYLIVFGSLVGYSAFLFLLRETSPARAVSHAYVNPVVAVLLGVGLAGEPFTPGMAMGAVLIVFATGLIVTLGRSHGRKVVDGRDVGSRRALRGIPERDPVVGRARRTRQPA
ncbi:MAG: EamA family transporter [Gemmatimonadetes bacterium]|nr:EamA family transporter [Gemmatimonadota bacterium]